MQFSNRRNDGWANRIWHKVQAAYQAKNHAQLERLLVMVLLRAEDLKSLTINEIQESEGWLRQELRGLEKEARRLRKVPAWGFSKRKDFRPFIVKTNAELKEQMDAIDLEIQELKRQHAFLADAQNFASKPRRRRRRSGRRGHTDQMSLF